MYKMNFCLIVLKLYRYLLPADHIFSQIDSKSGALFLPSQKGQIRIESNNNTVSNNIRFPYRPSLCREKKKKKLILFPPWRSLWTPSRKQRKSCQFPNINSKLTETRRYLLRTISKDSILLLLPPPRNSHRNETKSSLLLIITGLDYSSKYLTFNQHYCYRL